MSSELMVSGGMRGPEPPGRAGYSCLIVNADDWGRDIETTERTLDCLLQRSVSSVSAMVFMEDSERAAEIARDRDIDAGLHLNLTTPFSGAGISRSLREQHRRICRYLGSHRLAQVIFHPGLAGVFRSIVAAQLAEFRRLYGREPSRIDGHHHMHLCSNVLLAGLLPPGTIVRRNFSFEAGEKSFFNRTYRGLVDGALARRHSLSDFFFSLAPLNPPRRLEKIFSLAKTSVVEVETHPVNADEYRFLTGGGMLRYIGELEVAPRYAVARRGV
jgi:YdjC-like protein